MTDSNLKIPDVPVVHRIKRRPRHSTLTDPARRASQALDRVGITAYPGVISSHGGGGAPRVVVVPQANRVRIGISAHGYQEILLYGTVEPARVLAALQGEFGPAAVTVRGDIGGWQDVQCSEASQ